MFKLNIFSFFAAVSVIGAASMPALAASSTDYSQRGTWQTTLQGRDLDGDLSNGYEAYYDTLQDITWLKDAKYQVTTGHEPDGRMTWFEAMDWVSSLDVFDVTGWRLPHIEDTGTPMCNFSYSGTDCGFNSDTSTSELAHMYYVTLGNKPLYAPDMGSVKDWGLLNQGPFVGLEYGQYWSDNRVGVAPSIAFGFNAAFGQQLTMQVVDDYHVWVVHDGDVASAVPEPSAVALAMLGAVVVGASLRKSSGVRSGSELGGLQ